MVFQSNATRSMIGTFVVGMLLTGTLNTLSTKIQFSTESINKDGELQMFNKPWFGAFNMLLAMTLVGVVDKCWRCVPDGPVLQPDTVARLLDGMSDGPSMPYMKKVLLVAVPAAFDLFATAASCIGILYIPASVWQMLRGSSLIFAAIMSIILLKRELLAHHWMGLALSVVGVSLVGLAVILGTKGEDASGQKWSEGGSNAGMVAFGVSVVLLGQILQAAQVIAEEWLMKDVDLPAMVIVGFEGAWGILMFIIVVYPLLFLLHGSDHGHQEDLVDTVIMIKNSGTLTTVIIVYLFSCATFNATGIAVTGALSAVHRMMLDASRTILIWAFGIIVHYCFDETSKFGEVWTSYSFIQLAGFAVLVIGQAIYGGILRLPYCKYPQREVERAHFVSPSSIHVNSPLPPRRRSDEEEPEGMLVTSLS
eukprot:TRINITY_DN3559_c0_g1_i1.p1 TRINITY_DN3559_c0_g1~~TRINITY_DN3559_c0_g1_i1.p1  ORF type:complete len:422 (+),score=53.22 TRINITY_DN3559_c0_g1_i1:70-1335(+)